MISLIFCTGAYFTNEFHSQYNGNFENSNEMIAIILHNFYFKIVVMWLQGIGLGESRIFHGICNARKTR